MAPKSALLLQGPVGPFFRRFASELQHHGIQVTKVNFNSGDSFFFRGPEVIRYRDPIDEWPARFRKIVKEQKVDAIFLVGDCRVIHKPIIPIAQEMGIAVWVFEEGYLRPDHITLERDGVNGNSSMPKDPEQYRAEAARMGPAPKADRIGDTFVPFAIQSVLYACAHAVGTWRYPHYQHHRDIRPLGQGIAWAQSAWRKKTYAFKESGILERAIREWSGNFFLVPLQLHCDFQIVHSDYESIPAFMEEVLETFAEHGPADTRLLIKHHPLDRAYRDYTDFIARHSRRLRVEGRVHYIHDQHLPTLLKHARGVVTMNSTVGTSALYHQAPVKVMGRAIYNVPQLTYQGSLANFFCEIGKVDTALFRDFNRWMREHNQYNGSFYKVSEGICPEQEICERLVGPKPKADGDERSDKTYPREAK
ncbi:MAG: capsular biosynthesis protein [Myxococcales bacterium]|nr:capsular biosynthesis protein [Myxococcales bacterium]